MLGPNVQIYTATHLVDVEMRSSGKEIAKPIDIGKNVWIRGGSIIFPGIKIGYGTIIDAGSVVTRDLPRGLSPSEIPAKSLE